MMQGGRRNYRFIFTVSVLAIFCLLAIGLVLIGYAAATQHVNGIFEPFGKPTNVKHK